MVLIKFLQFVIFDENQNYKILQPIYAFFNQMSSIITATSEVMMKKDIQPNPNTIAETTFNLYFKVYSNDAKELQSN